MSDNSQANSKNELAKQYLEQTFKLWTLDKSVKEEEYRKPTSKQQLIESQELIDKARELNPDDEWTKNRIGELQGVVDFNYKKVFFGINFLKWAGFIIALVFFLIPAILGLRQTEYSAERVQKIKESRIEKLVRLNGKSQNKVDAINHGGKDYEDWSEKKKSDVKEKYNKQIEKRNAEIQKINGSTEEEFVKKLKTDKRRDSIFRLFMGSIYFIAGIFYKPAHTLPQYELHRRELTFRARALNKSVNMIGNIGSFIFREFVVKQPTGYKVTYRHKDGSKHTEHEMNVIPILAGFFLIWVPVMWYSYYIVLYPVAVLVNFVRNRVLFNE